MASPRFVPPPPSPDYASALLQQYEEGWRRRWLEAEKAQDEVYQRETADYENRVKLAMAQLEAAQREATAARNALADIDLKSAEGLAKARTARGNMTARIAAGKASAANIVLTLNQGKDLAGDAMGKAMVESPTIGETFPERNPLDMDKQNKALWKGLTGPAATQAKMVAEKAGLSPEVTSLLMYESARKARELPDFIDTGDQRRALIRNATYSAPKSQQEFRDNLVNAAAALREGNVDINVSSLQDISENVIQDLYIAGGKDIEQGGQYLVDQTKKGGKTSGYVSTGGKLPLEDLPSVEDLAADYGPAADAAQKRLDEALDAIQAIRFPDMPEFKDRITRIRETYHKAYTQRLAGGAAKPAGADSTFRLGTPSASRAKTPKFDLGNFMRSRLTDTATAEQLRAAEEKVAAAQSAVDHAALPEVRAMYQQAAPAAALGVGVRGGSEAAPPMTLDEMDMSAIAPEPPLAATPPRYQPGRLETALPPPVQVQPPAALPQAKPIIDWQGIMRNGGMWGRDGARTLRAERLAANTPEGKLAAEAVHRLEDERALFEELQNTPKALAIAAALRARDGG